MAETSRSTVADRGQKAEFIRADSFRNNHAAPAFNRISRYQGYTVLVTDTDVEEVHRAPKERSSLA